MFKSKTNGRAVITNAPAKYRFQAGDYEEVDLHFSLIDVPDDLRELAKTFRPSTPRVQRRGLIDAPKPDDVSRVMPIVSHYAKHYGVDEDLILAVIRVESNFEPAAKSPKGACGLMQLIPSTAAMMGVRDIFDPAENVEGGTQYLARLLHRFGNLEHALAAYNAGPGRVREYHGVPPFPETQKYVRLVKGYYQQYKQGRKPWRAQQTLVASTEAERASGAFDVDAGASESAPIVIKLRSGLTERADRITETDSAYIVKLGNSMHSIKKDLVEEVFLPE
ncbi:MAG TPA: hypothetical protein ENN80_00265 [Candidatus Hydrogenedentes bacterium]|nr:hypothetical protein [Candidatus Hydrogenedentota bacterium]